MRVLYCIYFMHITPSPPSSLFNDLWLRLVRKGFRNIPENYFELEEDIWNK